MEWLLPVRLELDLGVKNRVKRFGVMGGGFLGFRLALVAFDGGARGELGNGSSCELDASSWKTKVSSWAIAFRWDIVYR